jgi:hypothetical protein
MGHSWDTEPKNPMLFDDIAKNRFYMELETNMC